MLLWLWPAAAAPIQPLAWELPYASGVALKKKKAKKIKINIYIYIYIHTHTLRFNRTYNQEEYKKSRVISLSSETPVKIWHIFSSVSIFFISFPPPRKLMNCNYACFNPLFSQYIVNIFQYQHINIDNLIFSS